MTTEAVSLNLSRKWRSRNFDQIVGQDLAVRILKNSLYLGHYFPVYLFSGQRGCGKTSTARVFAAALNCQELSTFQKDPKKSSIPCLSCTSCHAMQEGKHPDFIEIDAASYTGVDHMRNIIESSALLPLMGRKRVYLIDEAHMLSKAAFNAALKILEEPPATALFILATTNPHKIIDTVRSRCFQLFFSQIEHNLLTKHLQKVCTNESIAYDDKALDIIVRHTQGSARDALNVLEQVRFSSCVVDKNSVLKVLGHIQDEHLLAVLSITLRGRSADLLHLFDRLAIEQYSADFIWQRIMMLLRALIWLKHGVSPNNFVSSDDALEQIAQNYSLSDLQNIVHALYENEELFIKTPMQHALLEMILLNLCQKDKKKSDTSGGAAPCSLSVGGYDAVQEGTTDADSDHEAANKQELYKNGQWSRFIALIMAEDDPLINSLFKQATFVEYDQSSKKVIIEFAKDLILFKEWLDNASTLWKPLLKAQFSADAELESRFIGAAAIDKSNKKPREQTQENVETRFREKKHQPSQQVQSFVKKKIVAVSGQRKKEEAFDVSDESRWKMASMLLRHFPGVVTEICEKR